MAEFSWKALLDNARLIVNRSQLEQFLSEVSGTDLFAVDTESAGFYKYKIVVNLIQVSTRKQAAILDPQALEDFSPLREFAEQTSCEWIFHGGDYDLRMLARDCDLHVPSIFDTRIAAELCGSDHLSLSSLAEQVLGLHLDKKLQRCDWSRRPLTPDMIRYGLLDAICMIPVRDALHRQLHSLHRLGWAQEEFAHLLESIEANAPSTPRPYPFLIKGSVRFTTQSLAVLKEVWEMREKIAERLDRAAYMVLSNQALLEIGRLMPQTMVGLSVVPCMGRDFFQRHGKDVIEAVKRGLNGPPFLLPRRLESSAPLLSSWEGELVKSVREVRERIATSLGLPGSTLMSSQAMEDLVRARPTTEEGIAETLRKWQARLLANDLIPILSRPAPSGAGRRRRRRRPSRPE